MLSPGSSRANGDQNDRVLIAGHEQQFQLLQVHPVPRQYHSWRPKAYNIRENRQNRFAQIVYDQIICLFEDIAIDAVKIGMVSSVELIHVIAQALRKVQRPPVVLDPVMISKSGYSLLKEDARQALDRKSVV